MPWSARFHQPIPVPGGKPLKTLADARKYVLALPAAGQKKPHWEVAAQTLMMESASAGHTMLSEIAIKQALAGGKIPPDPNPRKNRVNKLYS